MPARAASPIRLPKRAGGFPDAALAALLLLPALFLVPAVLALREPERLQGLLGRYAARARA
jgi:hypothetical protein